MVGFIDFADKLSAWFGKAFGWLIILMTLGMSYEVAARYLFNAPTTWSLDVSFIMYGSMFMMGGAYTLSRGGHVRATSCTGYGNRARRRWSTLPFISSFSFRGLPR